MKGHKFTILFFGITLFMHAHILCAQDKFNLIFNVEGVNGETKLEKTQVKDSLLIDKRINEKLYQLYYQGYLTASIKSVSFKESDIHIQVESGELFQLSNLGIGNIDPIILDEVDFKSKYFVGKGFEFKKLSKLFNRILSYTENHGYPFATIKLDSIQIEESIISANLDLRKGPKILFDSLVIEEYKQLDWKWLSSYLNIEPGREFSQNIIDEISFKMDELPFVMLNEEPKIMFSDQKAQIIIRPKERKVNGIDGILGVFPNAGRSSELLLTGSLDLHLFNLFSSAKELHLDWQKINVNSQTLEAAFYYPQFLHTPVGINVEFDLLKEDTLFLNNTFLFDLEFTPGKGQKIWFGSEIERSRTLGDVLPEMGEVPVFNDYSINYYGITYRLNHLNRRILPTNGWFLKLRGSTGQKNIIRDNSIDESFYEGIELKSTQYKVHAELDQFYDLRKGFILRLRARTGNVFGDYLFRNDLIRLGGLNSLRGFNENFFFVSNYALTNLELRIQNDAGTYFFVFYDQAMLRNKSLNADRIDYPFGTGLGLSFATDSGIFNFAFAVGQSDEQIFSLNSAKIHFGYTGRF